MTQLTFRVCAFALLIGIAFVTLSPIGLRPHTGYVNAERFLAFAALGLVASLGFPRRLMWVLLVVTGVAVALELLQLIVPTRDGRAADAAIKVLGGIAGTAAARVLLFARSH